MKITNITIKTFFSLFIIATIILLGYFKMVAEVTHDPNHPYNISKQFDFQFHSIECIKGDWRLFVSESDSFRIEVNGGYNLVENFIKVDVIDGILKLDIKDEFKYYNLASLIVYIEVPYLDQITMRSNTNLKIIDSHFPQIRIKTYDHSSVLVDSCSLGKVNVHAEQSSAIRFYRSEIDELKYFLKNKSLINSSVEPNKYDGKLNDSSYAKIGNVDLISDELKYNKLYFNIIPGLSPYRNEHKLDSIMQTIMYSGRESITGKSALPIPINFEGFVRGSEVISYKGGQLFEQTVDYWNFRYHKGMLSAVTIFFNANSDSVFELLNNNLMNILPDSSLANGKPDDAHESENIYGWVYKTDEEQHQYIQLRVINNKIELSFQIFGTNEFHFRPDSFFYTQYKFDRVVELISKRVLLNSDKDFVNRWEVENYDK